MTLITIERVSKWFGPHQVLKDVSIEISGREFVTFLGPSGCGKTTTLRLLAGFLAPDSGQIRVGSAVLSSPSGVVAPELRRMGMVFQNYAVWPHMSVAGNVAFGLELRRLPRQEIRERVARILAAVGLEGLEDKEPGRLSGGQQQRVALARSLIVEPDILLLDEPLSNLDAKLRERMRAELKALQRRTGITFVYVTHDQVEAMALSDRIAVFNAGAVQQIGPPREIYEHPANLFVADFMGLINKLDAEFAGLHDGLLQLRLGCHLLAARPAPGLVSGLVTGGQRLTLAIRPEAIRFGPEPQALHENGLEGRIREVTFLGATLDYVIDVGDGILVRAQTDRSLQHGPGSTVQLRIAIEDCVAMADEQEPAPRPPPPESSSRTG
ncbi:MAG: ABC transporter ATP-binding protein [Acetobacteraceae bacterium]